MKWITFRQKNVGLGKINFVETFWGFENLYNLT